MDSHIMFLYVLFFTGGGYLNDYVVEISVDNYIPYLRRMKGMLPWKILLNRGKTPYF
jgi:hypothetical protein